MNVLIKSAIIIDAKSDFHNTIQDILIENGHITKIARTIKNTKKISEIKLDNLHVSQGWFDSSVCFGEPGFEDRETIENGILTAAKSGFTTVALQANTHPIIDTNSAITFIKSKSNKKIVNTLILGALTSESKSIDLAELYDMHTAGAAAFYDYKIPLKNPNLLKIALQYAISFNGLVCSFPQDTQISGTGVMNENVTSTTLGLKGNPNLSENLQIARDLFILEYTGGKLHIPTISTAEAVQLIRDAKQKKLDVTCSVAIHNLFFTDEIITDFDTRYKVNPPLRTKNDIKALIDGLKDGTVDFVTSDHNPITIEDKKVEFDLAKDGTIGLESAFGALNTLFSTKKCISLLTKGKQRFGAETNAIKKGELANLTLFNPDVKYTFTKNDIFSKSHNSIFIDAKLKGKVYGVIANNKKVI